MTCFWDGILTVLSPEDWARIGLSVSNPGLLVARLQALNRLTPNVRWQNELIPDQQQHENLERIRNITYIHNGYDCSSCDPVLLLLAELLRINIDHNFNGVLIRYTVPGAVRTLNFINNAGHFWANSRIVHSKPVSYFKSGKCPWCHH